MIYWLGGDDLGKPNNILLARIDNRLIHGQIVCLWAGTVGANLIVVADDLTADATTEQNIMKMAASSLGYDTRFFSIQKTIDVIEKASSNQKILLICRTPGELRKIIEGGIEIKDVNIGNLHFTDGKKSIADKVYVNDKDLEDLEYIKKHVSSIYIQDSPDTKKEEF